MEETVQFNYKATFPCSAKELYDFHCRPGALERLIPPWDRSTVISNSDSIAPGSEVVMRLKKGPLSLSYKALHVEDDPGKMFKDIQHKGPFSQFSHTHLFSESPSGATLRDQIEFGLPFHRILPTSAGKFVIKELARVFRYREQVLREDILMHQRYSQSPLTILISGASGVLGKALIPMLTTGGHTVYTLVRRKANPEQNEIKWDPEKKNLNLDHLPKLDAVIHLAGEYIGLARWSKDKKREVVRSRRIGTRLLAETLSSLPADKRPDVLLSASAVGYYGDCGDTILTEDQPAGNEYLSRVCSIWERGTEPAQKAGIRTVLMRFGVGLTPRGGALERLLATGPLGIFKSFGNGNQYISWVSLDDILAAILHCMVTTEVRGAINISAPHPVTNRELLQTTAYVTNRPLHFTIPDKMLHFLYGQMASEIALSSCRVSADRLLKSGFRFRHPNLTGALKFLLGK